MISCLGISKESVIKASNLFANLINLETGFFNFKR